MSAASDHLSHDFRHERLCLVGSNLHLFVTYLYRSVLKTQIGDDADAECSDATVVGHNHLRHGAHADGIAAKAVIHLVFCRCLEGGALYADIYAMNQPDAFLLGDALSQGNELPIVGFVHVGETRTGGEILATQRMLGEEVDVVGDDHQVANLEFGVHASRGIAHEKGLDAQFVHDAHGECHLFHVVTFVIVETTFHGHDIHAAELAEDEFSGMSFYCRYGEMGNILVGKFIAVSDF